MDARTPPPIKLQGLTRDELLLLVPIVAPFLRERDLWRVRWEAAAARSEAAGAKSLAAGEKAAAAAQAHAKAPAGKRLGRTWDVYRKASGEARAANRAAERAYAAEQRIYRAYAACPVR